MLCIPNLNQISLSVFLDFFFTCILKMKYFRIFTFIGHFLNKISQGISRYIFCIYLRITLYNLIVILFFVKKIMRYFFLIILKLFFLLFLLYTRTEIIQEKENMYNYIYLYIYFCMKHFLGAFDKKMQILYTQFAYVERKNRIQRL